MTTNLRKKFNKIAVLGTGTMGSQIAAHLANCGVDSLLFGLTEEQDKKATASFAISILPKVKPNPLVSKKVTQYIDPLNYTDNLERLGECSLIIEAVSENIKVKQQVYDQVLPHVKDGALFASNTSGIKISELAEILPADKRGAFCGIHFFNPPRYMPLVELIPYDETDPTLLHDLEEFLTSILGKQVVHAKDNPGFIANRLGMFSMIAIFHCMKEYNLPPDTVDELCGSLIGRAKSACFRTGDIVGWDIVDALVKNLNQNLSYDPWQEYFILPDWLRSIIDEGHLGQKTGKGVYEKTKEGIMVYDTAAAQGAYRASQKKSKSKEVSEILKTHKSLAAALPHLRDSKDNQANFLWAIHRETFHYASIYLGELADNARDVDQAMMSGFGWEHGVFRLWQEAGMKKICDLIEEDIKSNKTMTDISLPSWIKQEMYEEKGAWSPSRKARVMPSSHKVYERQFIAHPVHLWPKQKEKLPDVIHEDESIRAVDLKDGVVAVNFKTKMNVLSYELIQSCIKLLDMVEADHEALILWQPSGPFCAGANLYQILAGAKLGKLDKSGMVSAVKQKAFEAMNPKLPKIGNTPSIKEVIADLQNLCMRMKHSPFPVVSAVQGLALGGGCELLLHSDRVVATNDSFIGLVESGVGVLPAGGGSKEMARRAEELSQGLDDWVYFNYLREYYTNIAMSKVATSATEAREMGYLRPSDKIIAHPRELLFRAKEECLVMMDATYMPPKVRSDIKVAGRAAIGNFSAFLANLKEGDFISEHDNFCATEIAKVLTGGDLDAGTKVSDQWFLHLERDGFINLLSTKLSQDRIEHTLKTGKPLRN